MVTLGVPEWRKVRLNNAEGNGECVISSFNEFMVGYEKSMSSWLAMRSSTVLVFFSSNHQFQ